MFRNSVNAVLKMSSAPTVVSHNVSAKQFYIEINGAKSVLDYDMIGDKIIDLYNTEVPVRLRGRGIAQRLADAALKYAKENNLTVRPTCSFIAKHISNFGSGGAAYEKI